MTYILRFGSTILTPTTIEVVEAEKLTSAGYETGPFASAEEAEARKKALLREYLAEIVRNGGESSFWATTPSGVECPPPTWVEEFGYRATRSPESEYYLLVLPVLAV